MIVSLCQINIRGSSFVQLRPQKRTFFRKRDPKIGYLFSLKVQEIILESACKSLKFWANLLGDFHQSFLLHHFPPFLSFVL